ncbi:MAG: transcriptional regulator [Candidatus Krumholzibacteria bacterium]|nr:transcriptional regulator [Candidatus Krumholzibacteria bacterium]
MQQIPRTPADIFVEGWGRMGTHWGLGKVMAEIQALLYLSSRPLSLEDMSERLKTSRSNVSLNVRALQDLGVVRKVIIPGDRKDYYAAEEDVARVARRLAVKKKKRELDPAMRIVGEAIAVTQAAEDGDLQPGHASTEAEKLYKLRDLLQKIAGVFETFAGDEPAEARSEEIFKSQTF